MTLNRQNINVLFDLQACQTMASANRGVGRYSMSLFQAFAEVNGLDRTTAVVNSQHSVQPSFHNAAIKTAQLSPIPHWGEGNNSVQTASRLDSAAFSSFCSQFNPDIIHISHAFEGFAERVPTLDLYTKPTGQVVSATLYDLIPLIFPEQYLTNSAYKKWYYSKLHWLKRVDLLLAISESSRQDAINFLGVEPWRIVNISGGVSDIFKPVDATRESNDYLRSKYNITGKYILYAAGDDFRKNISGAIEGYAALSNNIKREYQLVIACNISETSVEILQKIAKKVGLDAKRIVFTDYIPLEDLILLYSQCSLFIFPSLYEGFGLPILEAMACGAPVIGSNCSSIKDILIDEDSLFDPYSPESIASVITKALSDQDYLQHLQEYGAKRVKDFTWENVAKKSSEAFSEALNRNNESKVASVHVNGLPMQRLAVFTPLPPCRSGIADYNQAFLPFLSRHFEIDVFVDGNEVADALSACFRIFPVSEFESMAEGYDAILYEFGNSEFHMHMVELLQRHPGVVGLHDAYLSGMIGQFYLPSGDVNGFMQRVDQNHGHLARRIFAPAGNEENPVGRSIVDLPCTKDVLNNAIGVISHSQFNIDIANTFYPEGWAAPYRIIPQMVSIPKKPRDRAFQRARLGFDKDDFVITTFGHIVWTKLGDLLLDAFCDSALFEVQSVHLVFVGQLSSDDYGKKLKKMISEAGANPRIKITGYLEPEDYSSYLDVADLAVQLRIHSRGGTPKGVLDCLAHEVPVIVNNDSSYKDYPDDVAIKLPAAPEKADVVSILEKLYSDRELLQRYKKSGFEYVGSHHDPSHCAAQYAATINEFVARHQAGQPRQIIKSFAPHIARTKAPESNAVLAARWIDSLAKKAPRGRRVYIDVSHISKVDHNTGIQRVVKEVVKNLYISERPGFEAVAVTLSGDDLIVAQGMLESQGLNYPYEKKFPEVKISFAAGDILLMLDSSWEDYSAFAPVMEKARTNGATIITAIFDILPITLPDGYFVPGGREWFRKWLHKALVASDAVVCISKSVAEEVIAYEQEHQLAKSGFGVGYWHLGSDFTVNKGTPSEEISVCQQQEYLLMVGTLEPRKQYHELLDALDSIWKSGLDIRLCIVGHKGWNVDSLLDRINQHTQLNHRLFYFPSLDDASVFRLYQNAVGLLQLSKGEGFGLPIIEAANHGTPVLCSDIPVFREIAGDHVCYTDSSSLSALSRDIKNFWHECLGPSPRRTEEMPRLTWKQSAHALLDVISNSKWTWSKNNHE